MFTTYFVEKRNLLLLYVGPNPTVPLLTVANYCKWYELYLIMPDGTIKEISYDLLEDLCFPSESPWHDHVPNPDVVERLCEKKKWCLHEEAFEMMIGRWQRYNT